MSEWKDCTIGELGKIITGKTPRTAIEENYGGNTPFLSPSDNMEVKHVGLTNKTLSDQGVKEVKNCLLPEGSVCVSCIGSDLGKVLITTQPTVTNQQINSIIVNEDNDVDFDYYLMTVVGKHLNIISKTSTAVPIINKSSFSNHKITRPNLGTQKKIANILSSLDEKIETNQKINARLEELAQTLFKSWFIDFEPFGSQMPEDWEFCTLGDLTSECKDRVKNRNDVRVLSPLSSGELALSDEYFNKQVYSKDISKYIVVKPKTFAYNPARINIGSIGINDYIFDGCVSPVYVVFKAIDGYEEFINQFIKTTVFKEEVLLRAIGGVRQTLNYNDFSLIEFYKPSLSTVTQFSQIVSSINDTIKFLNIETMRLGELRDTLLPKLMSGELIPE